MKKAIILMAMLAALPCLADNAKREIVITMGTSTGGTQTLENVRGYIDSVDVSVSDGVSTGDVVVAYVPTDTLISAVSVATNAVTGTKTFRPRVDGTDIAGVDLSSDPPEPYMVAGDGVRFTVTGSPTGKTWKATIRLRK